VNDCEAQVFITSKYKAEQAAEILPETPNVKLRLMLDGVIEGYESFEAAVDAQPTEPLPDRVEGSDMLYSSGTTGRPKGVKPPLPDAPLGTPGGLLLLAQFLFSFDESAVYLSPAPLYHSAPLRFNMTVTRIGGTSVIMEHFDPEEFLRLIGQYQITHTQVVPTMFVRLLKLPEEVRAAADVSSLKVCIHAAAPCPVPVKKQMIEWWGPVIHEYYAGTEGNGFVYCNSEDWLAHPGTVGKALSGCSTSSVRTARRCPPVRAAPSTSRAAAPSSTTTTRRRRRARATRAGGAPSATWATWTTTASSTSPTARPS
jgi:long-chain acyl-CoA synthetase